MLTAVSTAVWTIVSAVETAVSIVVIIAVAVIVDWQKFFKITGVDNIFIFARGTRMIGDDSRATFYTSQ